MELLMVTTLLFVSCGLLAYEISSRRLVEDVHLPDDIKKRRQKGFDFKDILTVPALFVDRFTKKSNVPLDKLKKKLISASRPMDASQFIAFKFLMMLALPLAVFVLFQAQPLLLFLALFAGFFIPDAWLNNKIKKRQASVLRDLPHIIDLLNICVGAGIDFIIAVKRVIKEFRPCVLVEELKNLIQDINMGGTRSDALRSFATRINSPEVISFVRTLLQADRMGTPISEALKLQAEEIRIQRFQKGEEMALKAPIKLLFPLLFFILPVVLIIVAGPVLIQFTRGGFLKF